jgi:hypothetical protein
MHHGANRLALPYSFTSASPAKFFVLQPSSPMSANPKNFVHWWRRRDADSATFCATRLGRLQRRLRATLSSRFNPALPAFSRTPFVTKDIAIEDATCARGR